MTTRTASVQEALGTRSCEFPGCPSEADGKSQWCVRHRARLSGASETARKIIEASSVPVGRPLREVVEEAEGILDSVKTMRCKDPDCAEFVRSRFGPYSYCQKHRDERGIPTGAGGTRKAQRPSPMPPPGPPKGEGELKDPAAVVAAELIRGVERTARPAVGGTHVERLHRLMAAAKALDRAEAKVKAARADVAAARKAHREALAEAAAPHGVTHEAD